MRVLFLSLLYLSFTANAAVDLVKVEKSTRKMYLMEGNKIVRQYHIALGANPNGRKTEEGDKKTPRDFISLTM